MFDARRSARRRHLCGPNARPEFQRRCAGLNLEHRTQRLINGAAIDTPRAARLLSALMKRFLIQITALALAATGWSTPPTPPRLLNQARVLPLALDDAVQFRKQKIYFNDPTTTKPVASQEEMITFERQRVFFGAITSADRRERYGQYFSFFWRTKRKADLTMRFEYRQANLGSYVQAREFPYPAAKGSFKSEFDIIGDDFMDDGKVTAWRAVLIENGKIVALNQSFLWN